VGPRVSVITAENRKIYAPAENRTSTVQPIARRYNDQAILAHTFIIYIYIYIYILNLDRGVEIATRYWRDDREVGVRVPVESRNFSYPSRPNRHWVHPASYPMSTGGKAAGS
jgi:hypothetical protein